MDSTMLLTVLGDVDKRESLYHTALIYENIVKCGSRVSDKKLESLLTSYGSFEEIFNAKVQGKGLQDIKGLDKVVKQLLEHDFITLTINDEHYPKSLRTLEYKTPVLYCSGNIELVNAKTIAVVGTRQLEDDIDIVEGKKVLQRLLDKGYVIVSGLAKGCDTLAHSYVIEHGGKTIAVLGTPLNKYYPKENKHLQEIIASQHLVVTQYPIGIKTFPSHFAHRNKTTVGLSTEGVVVIRAGDKSGTQHAIKECIYTKKPLYVLMNNLNKGYGWVKNYKGFFKVPNKPNNNGFKESGG